MLSLLPVKAASVKPHSSATSSKSSLIAKAKAGLLSSAAPWPYHSLLYNQYGLDAEGGRLAALRQPLMAVSDPTCTDAKEGV